MPTLLFVNKIDRPGADPERVLDAIESRLTAEIVPMGSAPGLGARGAKFAAFGPADSHLAERSKEGVLHPAGTVRVRDRFEAGKVTAVRVFAAGDTKQRDAVHAGEIAKLWGLAEIQIGDWLGEPSGSLEHHFAPPTFEAVLAPADPADGQRLRAALAQLAEQDPPIDARQDDSRGEVSVSLYGEVQREVIQAMLAEEHGLEVEFRETTTI